MKPPFRLILTLLSASLFILILAGSLSFYLVPQSQPQCGVISLPVCGNVYENVPRYVAASKDSLTSLKFLKGKVLFKDAGCFTCHEVKIKKVGPPLQNISSRRDSLWIRKAIVNFQQLVEDKDKEAIRLFHEYNEIQMPKHEFLSSEEVEMIIFYLDKGVYQ